MQLQPRPWCSEPLVQLDDDVIGGENVADEVGFHGDPVGRAATRVARLATCRSANLIACSLSIVASTDAKGLLDAVAVRRVR